MEIHVQLNEEKNLLKKIPALAIATTMPPRNEEMLRKLFALFKRKKNFFLAMKKEEKFSLEILLWSAKKRKTG